MDQENFSKEGFEIKEDQQVEEGGSGDLLKKNGRHFFKNIILFFVIIIVVGGGYFVWNNYLSPAARYASQMEANYQKYLDWQKKYEEAMKADTYGGKTPEETLKMFTEALKNKDIELASKYFVLNENGERDEKWINALKSAKESGQIESIVMLLTNNTKSAGSWDNDRYGFEIRDKNGKLLYDINLILNKYSNVWKIESL
jgi:hypothetical protein